MTWDLVVGYLAALAAWSCAAAVTGAERRVRRAACRLLGHPELRCGCDDRSCPLRWCRACGTYVGPPLEAPAELPRARAMRPRYEGRPPWLP